MLKSCVLVGLDCAERKMFLLLHVTYSCIFHAYVPLFSIFLILILLVLFLSLSRLVCAWHLSASLLHPRTYFFSGHHLLLILLILMSGSVMIKTKNFSRYDIHSKRQVILSDFSDTDLPTVIHSRGWESLCDIPVSCPFMIIQEFYFNMHRFDYSIPHFINRV